MNEPARQIEIRVADARDATLVSVLGAVTFYEAYFEQDDPRDLARYIAEAFEPGRIRAELEDPQATFFIVFDGPHAVGYAKLRAGSEVDGVDNATALELQRIYLVERVFGRGIGERLLDHCLETARTRGYRSLWLGVWEQNLRAIRFYEKHAFRRVGELTFPYGETVGTNFVMERELIRDEG